MLGVASCQALAANNCHIAHGLVYKLLAPLLCQNHDDCELVVVRTKSYNVPIELEHSAIIRHASDSLEPRAQLRETREAPEDVADRTKAILKLFV